MKKILLSVAATGLAAAALLAKAPKDPVVMTIDGNEIRLSEFEYLYKKNNSQQLEPKTFDEYVELFTNYKLKVADAKAEHLDTCATFLHEFGKYRRDLARPYLKDYDMEEALIQEAYSHTGDEVYVSHIMIDLRNPNAEKLADSLYTAITTGAMSYEEAAVGNSIDKASAQRGGRMGWVTGNGRFPWAFEQAAFDTPLGEVSRPVNSGYGLHIIRPEERRPSLGEVHTRHILLSTRNLEPEAVSERQILIDSIYQAVTAGGADFAQMAAKYSEDPGSALKGGDLGWYGAGQMVQPFDSISFALANGEISTPFKTNFGLHIIQKLDSRTALPLDSLRAGILEAMENDGRAQQCVQALIDRTALATDSRIIDEYKPTIRQIIRECGGMTDSIALARIRQIDMPAYYIKGQPVSLSKVLEGKMLLLGAPYDVIFSNTDRYVKEAFENEITEIQIEQLEANNPDFRNLINEYRDGILLFDISNEKVWERASKDKEGLEAFFHANRDKYCTWPSPKYRAYIVFATDSATLREAKEYVDSVYAGATLATINQFDLNKDLRNRFKSGLKIERVIAAKGENPITDYLGFGSPVPAETRSNWKYYFPLAGEVIEQPVEALDVKGTVVTDYQNALEKEWLNDLRKRHTVKINKKQIKKADR